MKLRRAPFLAENQRVQSTDAPVQDVHSHAPGCEQKKEWLTHSSKRRTTRALRLLRKHHRSRGSLYGAETKHTTAKCSEAIWTGAEGALC